MSSKRCTHSSANSHLTPAAHFCASRSRSNVSCFSPVFVTGLQQPLKNPRDDLSSSCSTAYTACFAYIVLVYLHSCDEWIGCEGQVTSACCLIQLREDVIQDVNLWHEREHSHISLVTHHGESMVSIQKFQAFHGYRLCLCNRDPNV